MKFSLLILLLCLSAPGLAELVFWSDMLPAAGNEKHLSEANAAHNMLANTPDYYNPDTSGFRKIDYNDMLIMKIDDTWLELASINNNPSWSGSLDTIHKFLSFSMSNQPVDMNHVSVGDPWETFEPRLSNWQQASNPPPEADNSSSGHLWVTDNLHIRNLFNAYRTAVENQ